MPKTKVMWCSKCHAERVFRHVAKSTIADGLGFIRGIMAVASLGISETVGANHYYQCEKCGHIHESR